jgi:hypothetical protein
MPMLEFRLQTTRGKRPVIRLQNGKQIRTLEQLAGNIAGKHGIARRTAWKWYCRFRKSNFDGLADAIRADCGVSRYFTKHPDAATFVYSKFLIEGLSARAIHTALCRGLADNAPCYGTVRSYLKRIARAGMHHGRKARR